MSDPFDFIDNITGEDTDHLIDAADRFENQIDVQIENIHKIDEKAEHITKLLALLIGLLFSVISILAKTKTANGEQATQESLLLHISMTDPTTISFLSGVLLLLLAMSFAILTYLTSVFRRGFHPNVGTLLSSEDYDTDMKQHIRRTLGTFAYNIKQNREVQQNNAKRLKYSLISLWGGVLFLANSGVLFIGIFRPYDGWIMLGSCLFIAGAFGVYVVSGKHLTLQHSNTKQG